MITARSLNYSLINERETSKLYLNSERRFSYVYTNIYMSDIHYIREIAYICDQGVMGTCEDSGYGLVSSVHPDRACNCRTDLPCSTAPFSGRCVFADKDTSLESLLFI